MIPPRDATKRIKQLRQALQDIADYSLVVYGQGSGHELVLADHADMLRTLAKEALQKDGR